MCRTHRRHRRRQHRREPSWPLLAPVRTPTMTRPRKGGVDGLVVDGDRGHPVCLLACLPVLEIDLRNVRATKRFSSTLFPLEISRTVECSARPLYFLTLDLFLPLLNSRGRMPHSNRTVSTPSTCSWWYAGGGYI